MSELEKLLSTRRDVRVAVIGPEQVVSKYIGETEKNLRRPGRARRPLDPAGAAQRARRREGAEGRLVEALPA